MNRNYLWITMALLLVALIATATFAHADSPGNRTNGGVIYVVSQGLYYDTDVAAEELPPHGRFQLLEMGPNGAQTDYGPGDRGYVGGRWWMDTDGDGLMDPDDHYFSCPLLGPGRTSP